MEQQTATEYLFEQLWETPKDKFEWTSILEKAKQMEKMHIERAYTSGAADGVLRQFKDSETYYYKTYNK